MRLLLLSTNDFLKCINGPIIYTTAIFLGSCEKLTPNRKEGVPQILSYIFKTAKPWRKLDILVFEGLKESIVFYQDVPECKRSAKSGIGETGLYVEYSEK